MQGRRGSLDRSLTRGLVLLAALTALACTAPAAFAAGDIVVRTISNRADLISGGDALVSITLPSSVSPADVRARFGSRDVTGVFSMQPNGKLEGRVTGLALGPNVLTVTAPVHHGSGARLIITNHPNGGPLFAGPQSRFWKCEDGATDTQCNKPAEFTFVYRSTDSTKNGLQPYDLANPPTDVANTTTDGGVTVPFIVRVETGYQDRDQYRIATLYRPGQPWTWSSPQSQFNHKLLITHGASCGVDYSSGNSPSVTSYNPADLLGLPIGVPGSVFSDSVIYALGSGYSVMSTALDNNGHNCNVVTQAESLIMAKEHLIERYGTLRYTIGTGCSGGSLAQQWIANAYPGIYQGILPTCSFPDTWSSATQVMDYHLLRSYFEDPSHWGSGVAWSPSQFGPVEGNPLPVDAIVSDIGFFDAIVPTHSCGGVSDQKRYDPVNHPTGVRCSVADLSINVFGPRGPGVWSPVEQSLNKGFAGVPVDNVGVQYGLGALRSLQITPGQFADLNARVGGLSIAIEPTAKRIKADRPALANAYRSGMINETNNLDRTAIIDCRGPDPGAAHDSYRAFAIRARLDREHGTHANQLIWEGPAPIVGDSQCTQQSLIAMDRWVAAIEADHRDVPRAQKVREDKPSDIGDECFDGQGVKLTNSLCGEAVVPVYGTPRTVAGDAITTDDNKCRLRPLNRSDYTLPFTDAEWAKLQAAFPHGVCDFAKPGVDQQGTIPWLGYQDAGGHVIYGGAPLGAAPSSHPFDSH